jgi:bacterioferritin-associated ferredoxin
MIVCVCKAVSDRKIRATLAEGAASFDELQFELGVATCCGKCEPSVREIMAEQGHCVTCVAQHPLPQVQPHIVHFYERKAA